MRPSYKKILSDEKSGRITATFNDNSVECFLISIEAYYGLAEELFRMFGDDHWLILQKAGEGAGRIAAKSFPKENPIKLTKAIEIGFNGISQWGFGRYELKELDIRNKRVVFELYDSVFEYDTKSNKKFIEDQHFLIGFYKGFYSVVFGKQVYCNYSRLINNDRPYYRFEVIAGYFPPLS